ncbi:hypothetical protein [Sporosarcina sp.]|uniref:hypothetical protein n=1 Tax=Sporosarcina sp. TaxID=49982 RepID=UPI002629DABF|nr:hypothetical protein [Sporosarcina sp.]
MKAAIATMVVFAILSFAVVPSIFYYFFGMDIGDLLPIYSGMVLLSGVMVVCTKMVLEEIEGLKEKEDGKMSKK